MTLVSTAGPLYYPALDHAASDGGAPTGTFTRVLDAAGEKFAVVFQVPKAGNFSKVRWRTGTVVTGDTLKISFQNVDPATGFPDEVADQFRTHGVLDTDDNAALLSAIISSDGTDGGVKRAVTQGEMLALVFEFSSFVAGNIAFESRLSSSPSSSDAVAYTLHKTGGSWAITAGGMPRIAIEYDDGSYAHIPGIDPAVGGIAAETYNNTSTPDERGTRISAPFKCKVNGIWASIWVDGPGDLVLYDTDGTAVLESVSLDPDIRDRANHGIYRKYFDTEVELTPGGLYRVIWKPTSGTNASLVVGNYVANAVLGALPAGTAGEYTSRVDAGGWSADSVKRAHIGLMISQLDDGAGGGGGGGLRLAGHGGLAS